MSRLALMATKKTTTKKTSAKSKAKKPAVKKKSTKAVEPKHESAVVNEQQKVPAFTPAPLPAPTYTTLSPAPKKKKSLWRRIVGFGF